LLLAGSSIDKFTSLLGRFIRETQKFCSGWIFFESLEELVPALNTKDHSVVSWLEQSGDYPFDCSQDQELMNAQEEQEACNSLDIHLEDSDTLFILHLLHEIKRLDPKTRSLFKTQTQSLLHQLKYGEK
jgi:BESS motif